MVPEHKKICIVGAGGFAREVLCCIIDGQKTPDILIEEKVCFMVADEDYHTKSIMGIDVIPHSLFDPAVYEVVVGIGNPVLRKKVVDDLPYNTMYTSVIHPGAVISQWVEIGEGAIITAGTIITCNVKIGKHAHLNLHTTIGHDCEIGDYFTTTPGTNISGNCKFGNSVYFGTNSAVRQGIVIGNNVTIGMGGVVVKDILEPGIYVGNPVKKIS
ncbi:MAG: acetyltransferase [Ginsengibacter sp.]